MKRIKKSISIKINKAFKSLGVIDKRHESKKITQQQHNSQSKAVLKRLVKK